MSSCIHTARYLGLELCPHAFILRDISDLNCVLVHSCCVLSCALFSTVEKEQSEYNRNRRMSAIDLSRGSLKPGNQKEKVSIFVVNVTVFTDAV